MIVSKPQFTNTRCVSFYRTKVDMLPVVNMMTIGFYRHFQSVVAISNLFSYHFNKENCKMYLTVTIICNMLLEKENMSTFV